MIKRWIDSRVELLVDGVVIADGDRVGLLGDAALTQVGIPVAFLDSELMRLSDATGKNRPFGLEVGKRSISSVGVLINDGELAIIDITKLDECWIGGRLIRVPSDAT